MFIIGDKIYYGMNGLFTLKDIRLENVTGKSEFYYVLEPIDPKTKTDPETYIPVHNDALVVMMREVMPYAAARDLIYKIPDIQPADRPAENRKREQYYHELLKSTVPEKIVSVIKSVCNNIEQRKKEGKKGYESDRKVLERAENLLYNELSYALGISYNEAKFAVMEKIGFSD